jgi:hypothetical protein
VEHVPTALFIPGKAEGEFFVPVTSELETGAERQLAKLDKHNDSSIGLVG